MALPTPLEFVWLESFSGEGMPVMDARCHFTACLTSLAVWCDRLRNEVPGSGRDIERICICTVCASQTIGAALPPFKPIAHSIRRTTDSMT
jgi:hypothetical protein